MSQQFFDLPPSFRSSNATAVETVPLYPAVPPARPQFVRPTNFSVTMMEPSVAFETLTADLGARSNVQHRVDRAHYEVGSAQLTWC